MKQESVPCVGGPLDGQWWPDTKRAPVVPLRQELAADARVGDVTPTTAPMCRATYRAFGLTQPDGKAITVYAPEDWTKEQVIERLRETSPQGLYPQGPA